MKYEICVSLKDDILDPEARAILHSLKQVGYQNIKNLKVKKVYEIETKDENSNLEDIQNIAANHLSSPVSETFRIKPYDY